MKKRILILCLLLSVAMLFSSCEIGKKKDNDECEHTFSEAWSSDATNHWHRATCEHGEVKGDLAAHVDAGQDGLCDVCGYEIGHEHTYAADWSSDESKHWKAATCTHADQKSSEGVHADDDKNYVCDVCGAHVHIVNPATGYCDDCGKQITVIDTSNMATVLNAIVANANKIVSGTVDYDAIFRGLSSDVTMAHDVEYNVYTDGLYTKRVEGAWANEVWKKMQGEGAIGLSIEKTNGALTKAEPVTADVEGLAGYYYAVSTLADGYGAEDILAALYELAKPAEGSLNKVSDFTESIDQTARTAKFSYNILVINTDTAEGEDDGANYYEVEVEFSYSEANALTSLKIVCDCYTNSLKDVAEHDYTYDQATKTITMKDTAKADTYTFIVAQAAGTQTAITMPSTEAYVPTDLIIYADAAHTTVATTVTVDLGARVDDIPVFYVGCPEGTFIRFLDNVTVTVDKTGMTASLVGEQLQFYLQSAGTYVITLTSGSISKSVTVVVESDALWGTTEFEVTGTDNNTFDGQQYDFVAPVSGTYTIFVPAGCGAHDKADYDARTGAPYVDPNNDREGGSFNVTLATGQTYSFYFMVPTVGDAYTFSYNVVEHDVEIDDDDDGGEVTDNGTVTVGANSVIITQAEYDANTATRTFAVTANGNYKFAGDLFVGAVTDADGNAITRNADYTYTLEAGKTYTITFSMLSNFGRVGANALTITCESTSGGEEGGDDTTTIQGTYTGTDDWGNSPLTVVIDATTVTFNYSHPMMGDQTATYTYAIVDGAMVLYDENDNVLNPLAGMVTLTNGVPTAAAYNGTDYTLALGGSTGGDDDDDEGGNGDTAGTADNPIVIETLPTTITHTGEYDVYYTYTVTEDCTIIISSANGQACDPTYQLDTYNDYATGTFYIYARAGETVSINLYSPWGAEAGDEFTYSITTAAYASEGDQARPFGMYQDGEFTCQYPGGNDTSKYVWYKVNIYDNGYFIINFADRVNAMYGTDLDNLATVADATTKVEVAFGDVLYLAIQSFNLGEAEITFTTGWEAYPGTYDNPYTAVAGDNDGSIPAGAYEVYFAYTPAASGTITLTCTGASVYVYDNVTAWDWVSVPADGFAVSAGVTYKIKVDSWEDGATSVAFNLAFEEKVVVIEGELVESQVIATPEYMAKSDEYTFTAVAGKYIVNVTNKDTSTWFQIYDAASDSWPKYTDFPAEITLEAGEAKFRLYGWNADVAGTPVTVEFYLVEEIEGGDDDDNQSTAGTTMDDPIVLSGAGNYDAIVPANGAVYFTYTNNGASDVTFAFAVEGSNFWISYGVYNFNLLDQQLTPGMPNPATVTVAAGATLYIKVETYDMGADTINFSLTAEGGEASVGTGVKEDPYIIAGSGEFSAEVAANGEVCYAYTNDGASDVQVTLSFQGDNYYVAYGTYNFMLLDSMVTPGASDPVVTLAAGGTLYISVATNDYAADTIAFTVTVEATGTPGGAGSANVLVLGENAVDVTVTNYYANATTVTFTATEAGTYTLSAADGETNADVYITMGDWCELPYTFTLAAGETISFDVCSEDFMTVTEDTINLVLTKA